jgi:hypothetical protein
MSGSHEHEALIMNGTRGANAMPGRYTTRAWDGISLTLAALAACSGGRGRAIMEPTEQRTQGGTPRDDARRPVLTSPIAFRHRLEAQRTGAQARPVLLGNGDYVANGDRIQAVVTPAQDAYLYIGYCDAHELRLFPPEGGMVQAKAMSETRIPADRMFEIKADSRSEVFYLIASPGPLSLASPDLAIEIAKTAAPVDGDCAGSMRDDFREPTPPEKPGVARPSGGSIQVVRYELKLRPSTASSRGH